MESINLILRLIIAISLSTDLASTQSNFNTTANYKGEHISTVYAARGLVIDPIGDILVVSKLVSRITAFYSEGNSTNQAIIVNNIGLGLNHGLAYFNDYLYASSATTLYRWPYIPGQREAVSSSEQVVIRNMPLLGNHATRTPIFDPTTGQLYLSVGSGANVDPSSNRARIKRFNVSDIPIDGIDFETGEVFADGLRNEVGLAWDLDGVLWGVQNGADNLFREDLGGDIHMTNPAEEMTRYGEEIGTHYGYPYCWTVDQLERHQPGEQFAWPDFMNDGVHTDAWCKNITNNRPPTFVLPAHYAPLGITFYDAKACNTSEGAFPCEMKGDVFVAFHGSWNKAPNDEGFKVVRIPFNKETNLPNGEILDVIFEPNIQVCGRCLRPVNVAFDLKGHLIVSSDASAEIIRVTYDGNN